MKARTMAIGLGLALASPVVTWLITGLASQAPAQPPYTPGNPVLYPSDAPPLPPAQPVQPMQPMPLQPVQQSGYSQPMMQQPQPQQLPAQANPALVPGGMPVHGTLPANVGRPQETPEDEPDPTGHQEPTVSVDWVGPPSAKLGQPVTYQIVVKNIGATAVSNVTVRAPAPKGAKVSATEPKAANEDGFLVWHIGGLEPRQEKRLDLQIIPEVTGLIVNQATVSLSSTTTARLQVYQPQLSLKAAAPDKVVIGDTANVTMTVSNPGDAACEHVKLVVHLGPGLEHARGEKVEFDLGTLGPRENRNVQVFCGAKAAGEQRCEAVATAEPGLVAQDAATIDVLMPMLKMTVDAPKVRYLDRRALLLFKVTNPGTAPATQVTLMDQIPQGFKFVSASGNGRHDFVSRTVAWQLGDVVPGQTQEVQLELVAVNTGEWTHKAVLAAARGLHDETEAKTSVAGLSALLMELVDLDDPVEVGANTAYEIRVTNTGTKTETNLQLYCTLPDKMEFMGAKGPGSLPCKVEGKDVTFEPLPKLAPRADAIYRISVKGTAPGDLRFRARIKADGLTEPVLKEESTKVYGDDVIVPPQQ